MDRLHSMTLLLALIFGGLGVACFLAVVVPGRTLRVPPDRVAAAAGWFGTLALALGALSALVHLNFGHGPSTPEPMPPLAFLPRHPAYGLVLAAAVLSFVASRRARRIRPEENHGPPDR